MTKTLTGILISLTILTISFPEFIYAGVDTQSEIRQMQLFIEQNSIFDFLEAIEENRWNAPLIPSQWHIDNKASADKRDIMNESREFGIALACRVEEWAPMMISAESSKENERISNMFLQLAEWLAVPKGYGNLFLAARCQEIATLGVGRLLIDLNYPMEKTTNLLNKLNACWYASSICMEVLNREAGVKLFTSNSKKENDIKKDIRKVWGGGALIMQSRKSPKLEAALKGNPPKGYEEFAILAKKADLENLFESQLYQSNLDFFVDDSFSAIRGSPTVAYVKGKYHEKFLTGFRPYNISKLNSLATFRNIVGFFPKDNSLWGFEKVWRPYSTKKTQYVYSPAWAAYEDIRRGEFLEYDQNCKNEEE